MSTMSGVPWATYVVIHRYACTCCGRPLAFASDQRAARLAGMSCVPSSAKEQKICELIELPLAAYSSCTTTEEFGLPLPSQLIVSRWFAGTEAGTVASVSGFAVGPVSVNEVKPLGEPGI